MRYAIYFTPPPEAPLTQAAARWLGRDAFTDRDLAPFALPGLPAEAIAAATSEPRRYGFHATLKVPFRLAEGCTEDHLLVALDAFCAARAPFRGPRLALNSIDGFIALTPAEPSAALDRLAGEAVEAFEPFRAPLTEAEIARRRPDRLSAAEQDNLRHWGYPHVFGEFRFHMTLTGRLAEDDHPRFGEALGTLFGSLLEAPFEVGGIALFREPLPEGPFTVHTLARFSGESGVA